MKRVAHHVCRAGARLLRLCGVIISSAVLLVALPGTVSAYPSAEQLGTGGANPPFDFGITATATGFLLVTDRRLVVSYGETLKLIDVGLSALEPTQPPALSTDKGNKGSLLDIAYDSALNDIFASQDTGKVLEYDLDNVANDPLIIKVAENVKLGPIAVDSTRGLAYVADNTNHVVYTLDIAAQKVTASAPLTIPSQSTFAVTDMAFVAKTGETYVTTDVGRVFFLPSGSGAASRIDVDGTGSKKLVSIAARPAGDFVYVVDTTTPSVVKISTSSHAIVNSGIDISANPKATNIAITDVTNPSGTYAFVGGSFPGVSIIDTANDTVFDFDTTHTGAQPLATSSEPLFLGPSSAADGYVYMGLSTSKVGVLSTNPLVTVKSIVYSSGGASMKNGESVTITFQSDQAGTYEFRSGGSVDRSGALLKDAKGNTSGSVAAATDAVVQLNYNDNVSAFQEGANSIWIFVTAGAAIGRRAATVTVDTPPPAPVMRLTGFGTSRIYVTFDRITVSDMATYRIYVDTDPNNVTIKTDVAASVSQTSSGSTITGQVGGLTNGTTYYVAMDSVDAAGNVSTTRTSRFTDGSVATGMPEETVGPAGLMGEKGCSFVPGAAATPFVFALLMAPLLVLSLRRRSAAGILIFFFLVVGLVAIARNARAADNGIEEIPVAASESFGSPKPQMWEFEAKTGFWMPQSSVLKGFFGKCCNLITKLEGGLLLQGRYGVDMSIGFLYKGGDAKGAITGRVSQDRFNFLLFPIELTFTWRADYFSWRYLVPYLKAGGDGVIFREGDRGGTVKGVKWGMHGGGGVGLNIGKLAEMTGGLDTDVDIKEFFMTFEGIYQWINNFGGKGLNLSGPVFSVGMMFEF